MRQIVRELEFQRIQILDEILNNPIDMSKETKTEFEKKLREFETEISSKTFVDSLSNILDFGFKNSQYESLESKLL